jgi:hypothetical protein
MAGITTYFAGAIKGDDDFVSEQSEIIDLLREEELIGKTNYVYSERAPDYKPFSEDISASDVFQRDLEWLHKSKAMVAEVSGESFGTGWEIAYAQQIKRIPVLCLIHVDSTLPYMISGNTHKGVWVGRYSSISDLRSILKCFYSHIVEAGRELPEDSPLVRPPLSDYSDEPLKTELWCSELPEYPIESVALVDRSHDNSFQTMDVLRHFSGESIEIKSFAAPKELYKTFVRDVQELRNGVLLAECTEPSTDIGWASSYAQWNYVQPNLYYSTAEEEGEVSWLLKGQDDYSSSNWLDIDWGTPTFEARVGSHYNERLKAIPIPYADFPNLLDEIDSSLGELVDDLSSSTSSGPDQGYLSEYFESHESMSGIRAGQETVMFISECLVRNYIWPYVTVEGIKNTYISGERANILRHYPMSEEPFSKPIDLFTKIQHLVNYGEKAFAKNIRALKDVGIFLKERENEAGSDISYQRSLDQFGNNQSFPPASGEPGLSHSKTMVNDDLLLTTFGRDLQEYLKKNDKDSLEKYLKKHTSKVGEYISEKEMAADIPGNPHYLVDNLSEEQLQGIEGIISERSSQLGDF